MQFETVAWAVASGIISHVLFNRLEPRGLKSLLSLLLIPPIIATLAAFRFPTSLEVAAASYLLILGIYFGTLTASVILYRLSPFHPLASYPGPILCKITRLRVGYVACTGQQHLYYKQLHERYGSYVRTGPNHLHINDVTILPDVMAYKPFLRGERYGRSRIKGSTGSLHATLDPEEHAQRRKIWERGLTSSAIQDYADALFKRVQQLIEILEIRRGVPFDLSGWISCMAFDFMGDLTFGGAYNLMDAGKDRMASPPQTMTHMVSLKREVVANVPWLEAFAGLIGSNKSIRKLRKFALHSVLARKEKGSSTKDLFYYLLDEAGSGSQPLSFPNLILESTLAIVAGSDTTGAALSNLFFFLLTNPDVYTSLQAEVDKEFPKGADILSAPSSNIIRSMKYLNAVINETLRLRPAIPSGSQRRLPKGTGGIMLGEKFIPENTTVQMATFSVHQNPKYFAPSPEKFFPERWIEEGPGHILNYAAFLPFSYGPTNCVGKNLAMFEMRIVVCSLLQKFEFELAPGYNPSEWDDALRDHFIFVKGRLPVVIRTRG
ncbi:hypothetical protein M422DRAFT_276244 [Sphaerobolus stellatus SS14]|uniref:Cytochrome P450 n=1 Tax=Sphaerobolus stellatus (strain SS14) TaxID=990650 RepID=A0A0C9T306_SPHS4|nr:hypothetical protein M422DRAFT_276244 [Sphaerobolus stellatus SS14]